MIGIEDFHGQSERGVKQELFAHFVLITLTRLFSNQGEGLLGGNRETRDQAQMKVNFKKQPAGSRTTSRGSVPPAGGSARQHPQADRRRDCFVPAKAASEPILRPMFTQAGGQMETPQVGKGHRNEMKEKTR